jgi:hypothetical protein
MGLKVSRYGSGSVLKAKRPMVKRSKRVSGVALPASGRTS